MQILFRDLKTIRHQRAEDVVGQGGFKMGVAYGSGPPNLTVDPVPAKVSGSYDRGRLGVEAGLGNVDVSE